jgi:hypothetical protein
MTGQGQAVGGGVQGMGGIGKTVLTTALARDPELRLACSDGIYWMAVGQKPNLLVSRCAKLGDLENQDLFVAL